MRRHPEPGKLQFANRLGRACIGDGSGPAPRFGHCVLIAALATVWALQLWSPDRTTAKSMTIGRAVPTAHAGLVASARGRLPSPFESQPLRAARLGADDAVAPTSIAPMRLPGSSVPVSCTAGLTDPGHIDCREADGSEIEAKQKPPGRVINGRVLAGNGAAIAGVTVIATLIPGPQSESDPAASGYQRYRTISDANGAYSFSGLPNGNYTIRSNRHDHYPSVRVSVSVGVERADIVLRVE